MRAYKFDIGERVFVPGTIFQGIVVGRAEFRNKEPEYGVTWLDDQLAVQERGFKQSDLNEANEAFVFAWLVGRTAEAKAAKAASQ